MQDTLPLRSFWRCSSTADKVDLAATQLRSGPDDRHSKSLQFF
jgi:hypothetical protein